MCGYKKKCFHYQIVKERDIEVMSPFYYYIFIWSCTYISYYVLEKENTQNGDSSLNGQSKHMRIALTDISSGNVNILWILPFFQVCWLIVKGAWVSGLIPWGPKINKHNLIKKILFYM